MQTFYSLFLFLHSWNRWLILLSGLLLIILLISYLLSNKAYNSVIKANVITYLSSLHLQLIIGLILYFVLSPFTQLALNDFGAAMKNPDLRYWAVEHSFLTLIGIVLAQTGYSKSKKKPDDKSKLKSMLIWNSIAFFIILLAVPIGLMGVERPWFRF
ncbi:MAG TPA: hypothetical protein VK212_04890 [Lentimicrobium sp.]|nr:hypothetical protein [Lentimicrobium sp.]